MTIFADLADLNAMPLMAQVGRDCLAGLTVEEFSADFSAKRDESGLGQREWPNGKIYRMNRDGTRKLVAVISYNGKVWPPVNWTPDLHPIYDPYAVAVAA